MFDRRVKIFMILLIVVTLVLLVRAMQIQVVQRKDWADQAVKTLSRDELVDTMRGRLLDRNGNVLAWDAPCIDACVDYRAITQEADPKWLNDQAMSRINSADFHNADKAHRQQMLDDEMRKVQADIDNMWVVLARLGGQSVDITAVRDEIVHKVTMRQRLVWWNKYHTATTQKNTSGPSPWYERLLGNAQDAGDLDEYYETVGEQTEPHVILHNISNEANIFLGKNIDRFPGLVLKRGVYRNYPYNEIGAHVIGFMGTPTTQEIAAESGNELREYLPSDQIGKTGLEALCEPLLRGTRGRVERYGSDDNVIEKVDPINGMDVQSTIDIDLEKDVQEAFKHVQITGGLPGNTWQDELEMPGGAVVIDVASGEVLAMASNPSFNLNRFDDDYAALTADRINQPLLNRATMMAVEPGSTVKPMVGIGAITQGVLGLNETIECTGFLRLPLPNGKTLQYSTQGRCWTMKMYQLGHHQTTPDPHPTGLLTFSDALERSCNVFFETVGDRLKAQGLHHWFDHFGLGRRTGIGIAEIRGSIPPAEPPHTPDWRIEVCFNGIGQDRVLATPIQMANVAASIARDGLWMRPRLVPTGTEVVRNKDDGPDQVDLQVSKAALAMARDGMTRVVNEAGGTGKLGLNYNFKVAGKTGSAQASPLRIVKTDEHGDIVYRPETIGKFDKDGKPIKPLPQLVELQPGTHEHPNSIAPWYRGGGPKEDTISHAWFIGFAPADHPKIAFAVLVEYGGGGGMAAGSVVKQVLAACIKHGYLPPQSSVTNSQ